ncbi:hypothetical protein [Olleya sp. R77988]|uniref:hypothetical protein n=1 Tax=Olleya sp. R77988 TaxID=3093875 RepID=UPI0037C9B053
MKIKKILKRAAIIISVLLLLFKGFLMYRDYASYQDVIHEDADQIIKIKVDGITQSIMFNAITNPSFYLKSKSKKDTIKDDKKEEKGFTIPANVFLYTVKNNPRTTIFTSFKVSDSAHFKNHIKSKYKITNFKTLTGFTVASNKDKKVVIAFNDKQCVVAYNPSKQNVNEVFSDILVDKKTSGKSNKIWNKIKDANAHINFLSKNNNLHLDFKSGQALITGNLVLPQYLDTPKNFTGVNFSSDASVTLNLNLLSTIKYMSFKHNNVDVQTDSLSTYYNGHLALEMVNTTTQMDSIITYEYNEDFEKVETLTAVKKEVPEINMQLSSDASKLYNYLEKVSIIKQGNLSKEVFPLYQFKIDKTEKGLLASTNLEKPYKAETIENTNVFDLTIDFEKLQDQNHFPMINNYLEKLLGLKINGISNADETIEVKGQLQLKNKDINALAQFVINNQE